MLEKLHDLQLPKNDPRKLEISAEVLEKYRNAREAS
jgi:hypothetical protein